MGKKFSVFLFEKRVFQGRLHSFFLGNLMVSEQSRSDTSASLGVRVNLNNNRQPDYLQNFLIISFCDIIFFSVILKILI
ncbi:MAG: hypothetical protein A2Y41_13390 [Spirochaetes bacterium GWB1_36_13]|nr:MAG: hypothetical protein A2Y41_13390 [Spirochaetes bacterium GWB1_36_13]